MGSPGTRLHVMGDVALAERLDLAALSKVVWRMMASLSSFLALRVDSLASSPDNARPFAMLARRESLQLQGVSSVPSAGYSAVW